MALISALAVELTLRRRDYQEKLVSSLAHCDASTIHDQGSQIMKPLRNACSALYLTHVNTPAALGCLQDGQYLPVLDPILADCCRPSMC